MTGQLELKFFWFIFWPPNNAKWPSKPASLQWTRDDDDVKKWSNRVEGVERSVWRTADMADSGPQRETVREIEWEKTWTEWEGQGQNRCVCGLCWYNGCHRQPTGQLNFLCLYEDWYLTDPRTTVWVDVCATFQATFSFSLFFFGSHLPWVNFWS